MKSTASEKHPIIAFQYKKFFSFDYFITQKMRLLPAETLAEWERKSKENPPVFPDFSFEERQYAYNAFLAHLGVNRIASAQTIRRWFGLAGSVRPDREMIFRLALSLFIIPEDLEEYLTIGIGENGVQINDYRELIFLYCCKHHFVYTEALRFIKLFEDQLSSSTILKQHNDTEGLWQQYLSVCDKSWEDFFHWMTEQNTLFKGYSMTTLHYFQSLQEDILTQIKQEADYHLSLLLAETDFPMQFGGETSLETSIDKNIVQFIKENENLQSRKISEQMYQSIKELYAISRSSVHSNRKLLLELYASMDKKLNNTQRKWLKDTLGLTLMDFRYLSEIFSIGTQIQHVQTLFLLQKQLENKKKDQRCPSALCKEAVALGFPESGYASVKKVLLWIEETLAAQKVRCRILRRNDILCLLFYDIYLQYNSSQTKDDMAYNRKTAWETFHRKADSILHSCRMASLAPEVFPLDAFFQECFREDDMFSLADTLEYIAQNM